MSAGGYDTPHISASFSRYDSRRTGNIHSSYDRPIVPRRRSPSPGPSRRPYDSYVPERFEQPFRDNQSVYRPNNYRPGSSGWVSRSPSPDHYEHPARLSDSDYWERTPSWRGPPPMEEPMNWPDRKSIPPSPSTSSARGRGQRDDAISTRSFEPSNSWKQTQADRFTRTDSFPISERYNDRRGRSSFERSPDRLTRTDRSSASMSSDRYRLPAKRESQPPGRSDYDSYRPHYDNHWSPRRDPVSPSGNHNRRDSGSISHARTSDHFDTPPPPQRYVPRKSTPSPAPGISPTHSPDSSRWTAPESDNAGWSYPASLDTTKRQVPPPRPPSRSSIASTQVSVRKSPPPTENHSIVQPITPVSMDIAIVAVNGTITKEDPMLKLDDLKIQPDSEATKNAHNGNTIDSLTDGIIDSLSTPSVVKKAATDGSLVSPVDSVKNTLESLAKSSPIPSKCQVPKEIVADAIAATNSLVTNGILKSPMISSATPVLPTASGDTLSKSPLPISETPEAVRKGSRSQEPSLSVVRSSQPEMSDNAMHVDVEPEEPSRVPLSTALPIPTKPTPSQTPIPTFRSRSLPNSDEIPPLSDAKSKADALRIVVMTRLLCDHQSREERIDPVLMANLSIASPPEVHPTSNPGMLLIKMTTGQPLIDRMASFAATRPSLVTYLEQRQALVSDKATRLREEYLSLHESWVAHCTALNEQQKTLASEHEMQHGGRTTRRSTAITDAVRSDFEMEQIIASLGNDDATDPNHLSMRNLAQVPDMISVVNGKVDYLFDDTADRVENPSEYFAPDTGICDWTEAEKSIYLDKFAAHPKQFGVIADHLPNKTARQCVDYYYLHKKRLINFRKVVSQFAPNKRKRRGMGKKKGNGLLADIAMHDAEVYRDSGSTASVVSRAPRGRKTLVQTRPSSTRRNAVQFEVTPTSTPTPEPEARPRRRRMLNSAAISSTTSSFSTINAIPTASSSMLTFRAVPKVAAAASTRMPVPPVVQNAPAMVEEEEATEPDPESRPAKRPKRARKIKSAATVSDEHGSPCPEVPVTTISDVNVNDSAARGKKAAPHVLQWSEDDKNLFLSLLAQYGDDFKRIAASMPNKTTIQVSNYYKSNLTELDLEKVAATAPKRSPTPTHRESRKELPFPTSVTLAPSTPVQASTPTPTTTSPMSTPMSGIFREPTGIPRQPVSAPTSTFPGRNVSAGKPLSSDIIHSPPPPWSSPLPSSRPVSRISQPLSRPSHTVVPNIRHPPESWKPEIKARNPAMPWKPEYPPDIPHERVPYGKPPDNVNLTHGSIHYGRSSETRQYVPPTYSPPGISSNGRGYRPHGSSHGSSPIMTHPNTMPPLSQHVRTPYVYPPTEDHRNSIPIPSPHNPPGRSSHMYPPEHSAYPGYRFTPPLYEDSRSPSVRYPYPPIRQESFQRSPPPFDVVRSGPSLKRRLDPPYPDYPNTLGTSPTDASTSASSSASNPNIARVPSRTPYPYYSE